MESTLSPAKRSTAKARLVARHRSAAQPVDEHVRLKKSKVNADLMDAAVKQLAAGKGVEWNPFKK